MLLCVSITPSAVNSVTSGFVGMLNSLGSSYMREREHELNEEVMRMCLITVKSTNITTHLSTDRCT